MSHSLAKGFGCCGDKVMVCVCVRVCDSVSGGPVLADNTVGAGIATPAEAHLLLDSVSVRYTYVPTVAS
jgi:hypothetical protein